MSHRAPGTNLRRRRRGNSRWRVANVNPGGTPNKVWQYLALGKPAVVSNLPNMKYITYPENSVYITKSNDDLVGLIEKAYAENTIEQMEQRIEFAHRNTWDHRFEEFISLFNEHVDDAFNNPSNLKSDH